jgi:sarcosine oxidase
MRAAGVAFEMFDQDEIMRRYPQFRVGADIVGMFQEEGGIALAAHANAAHRRLARTYGATLFERTKVLAVRPVGGEYEIDLGERSIRCRRLVIAAGPWSSEVLKSLGIHLPTTVTKEQVTYFALGDQNAFSPGRFPVWIWMVAVNYYGFPALGGAIKTARDRFEVVDPNTRGFATDPANEADVRAFLERLLPGAAGAILRSKTCLLTLTPDLDFVLDEVPGYPGCYAVVGAGHAFKFASAIGRILGELCLDGRTGSDISPFAFSRAALASAARRP